MDELTALFSRKDMTFEEAVAYFKERVQMCIRDRFTTGER